MNFYIRMKNIFYSGLRDNEGPLLYTPTPAARNYYFILFKHIYHILDILEIVPGVLFYPVCLIVYTICVCFIMSNI